MPNLFYVFFKYASAYLLRGVRHALHDIIHLRTSAILPERLSYKIKNAFAVHTELQRRNFPWYHFACRIQFTATYYCQLKQSLL